MVNCSIKSMLDPKLTASWEKGLTMVADGDITSEEYMVKLKGFISRRTDYVKQTDNRGYLNQCMSYVRSNYTDMGKKKSSKAKTATK